MGSVLSIFSPPTHEDARRMDVTNLFAGYGAYHHNFANKVIHFFGIPLILWSAMGFAEYCPIKGYTVPILGVTPNYVYPIYLHLLKPLWADLPAGLVTTSMYGALLVWSQRVFHALGPAHAWKFFLGVHILSWLLQFYGHAVFEKRRPALVDNIFQIFSAPFFVVLETLFALGYKPWLNKACEEQILENIKAMDKKAK